MRLLSVGIETISAAVVLLPFLLIVKRIFFQNTKNKIYYVILAIYLSAVYSVVGLPTITYTRLDLTVNFIPITTMIGDMKNSILNVILFIPLGIALPCLWKKFISIKHVILFGFGMSLIIEILQIFTYRATDISDLITNTMGTIIGYSIAKGFIEKQQFIQPDENYRHLYILSVTVFVVMFFIQPFVSSILWDIVLPNLNL